MQSSAYVRPGAFGSEASPVQMGVAAANQRATSAYSMLTKKPTLTQTHPLSDCRNEKAGGFTATAERTYRVSVDSKAGRARKTARSSAQEATTKVQAEEKGFQIDIRFICPR